jgi:mycothiol system anti-sigma-R factor
MDDPFTLDPDCQEAVHTLYHFLDGELTETSRLHIQQHLDECGPCLQQFGLEQLVKDVVKRGCGCEPVPDELRSRVMYRLREVQIQISVEGVAEGL